MAVFKALSEYIEQGNNYKNVALYCEFIPGHFFKIGLFDEEFDKKHRITTHEWNVGWSSDWYFNFHKVYVKIEADGVYNATIEPPCLIVEILI